MNLKQLGDIVPTPDDSVAWYDIIGKFRNAVSQFQSYYNALQSENIDSGIFPKLADEQLILLQRGADIKSRIQSVTSAIDDAWNWVKGVFGFSGLREADTALGGLGIPLIPIAVVGALIAYMGKYGLDYIEHQKTYALMQRLLNEGYSPAQVNEMITGVKKESALIDFGKLAPVAFVGVVGLLGLLAWRLRGQ